MRAVWCAASGFFRPLIDSLIFSSACFFGGVVNLSVNRNHGRGVGTCGVILLIRFDRWVVVYSLFFIHGRMCPICPNTNIAKQLYNTQ